MAVGASARSDLCDEKNDVRTDNELTKQIYLTQRYAFIVCWENILEKIGEKRYPEGHEK